jgi:glycosyltransferase involved in cell wall biosynthesis
MRILIFTQKVDKNDPVLGFFHGWIIEISKKTESVEVVCLEKGQCDLPDNVTVYSLGKENGVSKLVYVFNFYKYLISLSGLYDKVFVHMNQEYVLLGGLYWKIKGIPVYLWRNHPNGSILTRIAVALSTKVFCASTESFTARFKKTVIMPAGVNTDLYRQVDGVLRKKYSICMVGRISPIKHIDLAIEAMKALVSKGVPVSLDIIGPVLEKDKKYYDGLGFYVNENNLSKVVHFINGVSPEKLPEVYSEYEICLNLTPSGSFDKTIVEAPSCGTIPLVSNASFKYLLPSVCITNNNPQEIATSIVLLLDPQTQINIQKDLEKFIKSQSLSSLMSKLFLEIK